MHPLQQIFEDAGVHTRSYSGRAMYGSQCLAIVVADWRDVLYTIVEGVDDENRDALAEAVSKVKLDSMGREMVVYFPGIPFVDQEDGEV